MLGGVRGCWDDWLDGVLRCEVIAAVGMWWCDDEPLTPFFWTLVGVGKRFGGWRVVVGKVGWWWWVGWGLGGLGNESWGGLLGWWWRWWGAWGWFCSCNKLDVNFHNFIYREKNSQYRSKSLLHRICINGERMGGKGDDWGWFDCGSGPNQLIIL